MPRAEVASRSHDVSPLEHLPEVVLELDGVLLVLREDREVGVAVGLPIPVGVPIPARAPIPLFFDVGVVDRAVPSFLAIRERDALGELFLKSSW